MSGIGASVFAFGLVFGLAARSAGYSPIEAVASSVVVFAGSAQFAAVGLVAAGVGWPLVVLTTFLLNVRHLLYSAALRPWVVRRSLPERAAMAHVLTDEAFALSSVHFRRLGWPDAVGYWLAAIGAVFIPWNLATVVGVVSGGAVADPTALGLDVVFPAAMAGIAVALIAGRRELIAAVAAVACAVLVGMLIDPRVGIVAGGLIGPLVGLTVPSGRAAGEPSGIPPGDPVP
jgi:predicted branched-subunit amino acid permease